MFNDEAVLKIELVGTGNLHRHKTVIICLPPKSNLCSCWRQQRGVLYVPTLVDGQGTEARLFFAYDMVQIPDMNVWIFSELTHNCLRQINIDSLNVSTFSGVCDTSKRRNKMSTIEDTRWDMPSVMAYDNMTTQLYVSSNGAIRVIDLGSGEVKDFVPIVDAIHCMSFSDTGSLLVLFADRLAEFNQDSPSRQSTLIGQRRYKPLTVSYLSMAFKMIHLTANLIVIADDANGLTTFQTGMFG